MTGVVGDKGKTVGLDGVVRGPNVKSLSRGGVLNVVACVGWG